MTTGTVVLLDQEELLESRSPDELEQLHRLVQRVERLAAAVSATTTPRATTPRAG
jgi:hypothetical protein